MERIGLGVTPEVDLVVPVAGEKVKVTGASTIDTLDMVGGGVPDTLRLPPAVAKRKQIRTLLGRSPLEIEIHM